MLLEHFNINKELLSKATLLYVEDDEVTRHEIEELFSVFFRKVFVASNGKEALDLYKNHENEIDLILTDLNMPIMNGIDFISNIRDTNWEVPILVNTAFDDSKTILKVIKLHIANYILKPMQINTTLKIVSKILEEVDKTKEIVRQKYELNQFMSILDSQNLICEYDIDGNIINANTLFCVVSHYSLNELIGKRFDFMRFQNSSDSETWNYIKSQNVYSGKSKNIAKDGSVFYVNSTIFPIYDKEQSIIKFRAFCYLRTDDEEEKNSMKKQIISLKSVAFKEKLQTKELETKTIIEEKIRILQISHENENLYNEIEQLKKEKQYLSQKLEALQRRVEEYQYEFQLLNTLKKNKASK